MSTEEPRVKILTWKEAREAVLAVNPSLVEQIDQLDPGEELKLVKATYKYGDTLLSPDGKFYLPTKTGVIDVKSDKIDKQVQKALIAPIPIPMGIILNKTLESDLVLNDRVLPFGLMKKGKLFALWGNLQPKNIREVNGRSWWITAGARSVAMLPKISDAEKFKRVKDKYNLINRKPNNFFDQNEVFANLAKYTDWRVDIIFFSRKWEEKFSDPSWAAFRGYLYETAWHSDRFLREKIVFEADFARILLNRNLKPSTYIADTVKHLYALAAGDHPGFKFSNDSESLPVEFIQQVFVETYGLKYLPSILQPGYVSHCDSGSPIYYLLQWPTALAFSPKSDRLATKLTDLGEIKYTLESTLEEIQKSQFSVMIEPKIYQIANEISFNFYHDLGDEIEILRTESLFKIDNALLCEHKKYNMSFCNTSSLIRGCTRISIK